MGGEPAKKVAPRRVAKTKCPVQNLHPLPIKMNHFTQAILFFF